MNLKNKVAVITGTDTLIGRLVAKALQEQGATVCALQSRIWEAADERHLTNFADQVIAEYGGIDFLLPIAMLTRGGIENCSFADFNIQIEQAVIIPFFLVKLFRESFRQGGKILSVFSTLDAPHLPNCEAFYVARSGIEGLVKALARSLAGKPAVNSLFLTRELLDDSEQCKSAVQQILYYCKGNHTTSGENLILDAKDPDLSEESGWKCSEYHWN